jgi:hypothetical protein
MAQDRPTPRDRKIAELQAQMVELHAKLAECEKLRTAREITLMEDGLRLSQENEALRLELAALKKSRKLTA